MFNSFFVSVFNQKDTNFHPKYPRKNLNWFRINQGRVETLLEDRKIGKSSGSDKIWNILLRNAAKGLSKSVTLIFQTIINKGTYPNQWKFGQICPVFKDGDKKDVTCYRPKSLLSCISKVLERIIFDEIYPLVQEKLHTKQFGFRKKKSTTLQLLLFLDRIYKYKDDNEVENLSVLYLDFSKHLTPSRTRDSSIRSRTSVLVKSSSNWSTATYQIANRLLKFGTHYQRP